MCINLKNRFLHVIITVCGNRKRCETLSCEKSVLSSCRMSTRWTKEQEMEEEFARFKRFLSEFTEIKLIFLDFVLTIPHWLNFSINGLTIEHTNYAPIFRQISLILCLIENGSSSPTTLINSKKWEKQTGQKMFLVKLILITKKSNLTCTNSYWKTDGLLSNDSWNRSSNLYINLLLLDYNITIHSRNNIKI